MVVLGKFEKIQSNWPNQEGIVVTDREKFEVKVYEPENVSEEKRLSVTNNTIINKGFWYKIKKLFK